MRFARYICYLFFVNLPMAWADSPPPIIPNGETNTQVTTDPNGVPTVTIAPVFSDHMSYNAYSQFNVPKQGANLDNNIAHAHLIINEVKGVSPSLLEGQLTLLGPKAHVIIANPNGITVDGGRFINVSNVALSTGTVSFVDRAISPFGQQKNAVLTTDHGTITIQGNGLSGTMNQLDLIAKNIKVDGALKIDEDVKPAPMMRLAGGHSSTEFDSSVTPANLVQNWDAVTATDASSTQEVLVDITPLGSVEAGTVKIAVTDIGAGVHIAGDVAATADDFVLTSNGDIEIENAAIHAKRDLLVKTKKITATSSHLKADRDVELNMTGAHFSGGSLEAGSEEPGGNMILGQKDINAENDFIFEAAQTESGDEPLQLKVKNGGLGLYALSQNIIFSDANLAVDQQTVFQAKDFLSQNSQLKTGSFDGEFSGDVINQSSALIAEQNIEMAINGSLFNQTIAGGSPALIYSQSGDLLFDVADDVWNQSGRFIANQDIAIHAGGELINETLRQDTTQSISPYVGIHARSKKHGWFHRKKIHNFSLNYLDAALLLSRALIIADGDLFIHAQHIQNLGGEFDANDGDLILDAYDIDNIAFLTGHLFFDRKCHWVCNDHGFSNLALLGGNLSASKNMVLHAEHQLTNQGGTLFAFNDFLVDAPIVLAKGFPTYRYLTRTQGSRGWFGSKQVGRIRRLDEGGSFIAFNHLVFHTDVPVLVDGGRFVAGRELIFSNGQYILSEPISEPLGDGHRIGLAHALFS